MTSLTHDLTSSEAMSTVGLSEALSTSRPGKALSKASTIIFLTLKENISHKLYFYHLVTDCSVLII
jgi:hypothetical protein